MAPRNPLTRIGSVIPLDRSIALVIDGIVNKCELLHHYHAFMDLNYKSLEYFQVDSHGVAILSLIGFYLYFNSFFNPL